MPDSGAAIDRSRRRLLQCAGVALAALATGHARALAAPAPERSKLGSKLVLLGTAGGPTPKRDRSAPANAIAIGHDIYVVDCGDGVARQMVLAGLDLKRIRDVFITHQHSDHNAGYGNLLLLAWETGLNAPVNTYGPPPLAQMTERFLEMQACDIQVRERDEGRPPLGKLFAPHEITRAGPVMHDANVKVTAALVQHPLVSRRSRIASTAPIVRSCFRATPVPART
jgi:ribonuclease BN (tRNA processing enzyme)